MRRLTYACVIVGALALSGCPEAPSNDAGEGSGEATPEAEGSAEETAGAPAEAHTSSAMPDVAAEIPTEALAYVPESTDLLVLVDLASVRTFGIELFGLDPAEVLTDANEAHFASFLSEIADIPAEMLTPFDLFAVDSIAMAADVDTETFMIVTQAAAFEEAPEDGAEPTQVGPGQLAVRGDWAVYGMGEIHTEALDSEVPRFVPSDAWGAGWEAIPSDSAITVFVPDVASGPEAMQRDLTVGDAQIQRFAVGVPLSGQLAVAIESDPADVAARILGAIQHATMTELWEEMDDEGIPEAFGGWTDYIELAIRSFWAQVQLETTGNVSVVSFAEPPCGSAWMYPAILAAGSSIIRGGGSLDEDGNYVVVDPFENATPFQPVDQRVSADCGALDGPAPNLPVSLTRLAPADGDGFLVLADVSGAMRAQLPRAGGILPFAMHPDDIAAALGDSPLGLDGLGDAEGSGAIYMPESAMVGMPEMVVVGWPGVDTLFDDDARAEMSAMATLAVREGLGWTASTEGLAARLDAELDTSSPWYRIVDELPGSTVSAVVFTPFWPDNAAEEIPEGGLRDLVAAMTLVSYSSDGRGVPTLRMMVDGDPTALASAAQTHATSLIQESVEAMVGEMGALELLMGRVDDFITLEAVGEDMISVELNIDPSLGPIVPTALGAGIWATMFVRQGSDASMPMEATEEAVPVEVDVRVDGTAVEGP